MIYDMRVDGIGRDPMDTISAVFSVVFVIGPILLWYVLDKRGLRVGSEEVLVCPKSGRKTAKGKAESTTSRLESAIPFFLFAIVGTVMGVSTARDIDLRMQFERHLVSLMESGKVRRVKGVVELECAETMGQHWSEDIRVGGELFSLWDGPRTVGYFKTSEAGGALVDGRSVEITFVDLPEPSKFDTCSSRLTLGYRRIILRIEGQ